eukprot:6198294-Pleurochrysis_carterae.AAC.3
MTSFQPVKRRWEKFTVRFQQLRTRYTPRRPRKPLQPTVVAVRRHHQHALSSLAGHPHRVPVSDAEKRVESTILRKCVSPKLRKCSSRKCRWGAFVSYDCEASMAEAQWLQSQLDTEELSLYINLDGDENYDASTTAHHIRQSKVFVLLQTKRIYDSPQRLFEVRADAGVAALPCICLHARVQCVLQIHNFWKKLLQNCVSLSDTIGSTLKPTRAPA